MQVVDEPLINIKAVLKLVPVSRPTIYRMMQKGEFPRPIEIGASRFWLESEVSNWKIGRIQARNG
jgi:prophage regulatory protein